MEQKHGHNRDRSDTNNFRPIFDHVSLRFPPSLSVGALSASAFNTYRTGSYWVFHGCVSEIRFQEEWLGVSSPTPVDVRLYPDETCRLVVMHTFPESDKMRCHFTAKVIGDAN